MGEKTQPTQEPENPSADNVAAVSKTSFEDNNSGAPEQVEPVNKAKATMEKDAKIEDDDEGQGGAEDILLQAALAASLSGESGDLHALLSNAAMTAMGGGAPSSSSGGAPGQGTSSSSALSGLLGGQAGEAVDPGELDAQQLAMQLAVQRIQRQLFGHSLRPGAEDKVAPEERFRFFRMAQSLYHKHMQSLVHHKATSLCWWKKPTPTPSTTSTGKNNKVVSTTSTSSSSSSSSTNVVGHQAPVVAEGPLAGDVSLFVGTAPVLVISNGEAHDDDAAYLHKVTIAPDFFESEDADPRDKMLRTVAVTGDGPTGARVLHSFGLEEPFTTLSLGMRPDSNPPDAKKIQDFLGGQSAANGKKAATLAPVLEDEELGGGLGEKDEEDIDIADAAAFLGTGKQDVRHLWEVTDSSAQEGEVVRACMVKVPLPLAVATDSCQSVDYVVTPDNDGPLRARQLCPETGNFVDFLDLLFHTEDCFALCSNNESVLYSGDNTGAVARWDFQELVNGTLMTTSRTTGERETTSSSSSTTTSTPFRPHASANMGDAVNDLCFGGVLPSTSEDVVEIVYGTSEKVPLFELRFTIPKGASSMIRAEVTTLIDLDAWTRFKEAESGDSGTSTEKKEDESGFQLFSVDYFEDKFLLGCEDGGVYVLDKNKRRASTSNNSAGVKTTGIAAKQLNLEQAVLLSMPGVHVGGVERVKWKKFASGDVMFGSCGRTDGCVNLYDLNREEDEEGDPLQGGLREEVGHLQEQEEGGENDESPMNMMGEGDFESSIMAQFLQDGGKVKDKDNREKNDQMIQASGTAQQEQEEEPGLGLEEVQQLLLRVQQEQEEAAEEEDALPKELFFQHRGHKGDLRDFAFCPYCDLAVASISTHGEVQLWRVNSCVIRDEEEDESAVIRDNSEFSAKRLAELNKEEFESVPVKRRK
ncbi:unnamed protein product [Amoebophrya sp. A25]|nr:unnamed protein product [Amoebophrya sp. A25]|eukprot:GSA25T00026006001.1